MSAHTPGPWRVGRHANGESHVYSAEGIMAPTIRGSNVDQRFANALMMASAPDLLAALVSLLPLVREYDDDGPTGAGWQSNGLSEAIYASDAAIAKATGSRRPITKFSTNVAEPDRRGQFEYWWHEGAHPYRSVSGKNQPILNEHSAWHVWIEASRHSANTAVWNSLVLIESIASGSTTANSLPNVARIARSAIAILHGELDSTMP